MWTVVYTAQSKDAALQRCSALEEQSILVKIIGTANENRFDILVPAAEVEQAHNILIESGI